LYVLLNAFEWVVVGPKRQHRPRRAMCVPAIASDGCHRSSIYTQSPVFPLRLISPALRAAKPSLAENSRSDRQQHFTAWRAGTSELLGKVLAALSTGRVPRALIKWARDFDGGRQNNNPIKFSPTRRHDADAENAISWDGEAKKLPEDHHAHQLAGMRADRPAVTRPCWKKPPASFFWFDCEAKMW
jgi:hypothetical protein